MQHVEVINGGIDKRPRVSQKEQGFVFCAYNFLLSAIRHSLEILLISNENYDKIYLGVN
jgi:hypothetical protein